MKLKDWLPHDSFVHTDRDHPAHNLLNLEVVTEYDLSDEVNWKSWVGTHKNVMNWCVLATGHAVGWNESPSRGWSFPVKKIF